MRRLLVSAIFIGMICAARPAEADLIDPFIGLRGGGGSTNVSAALNEPLLGVPCDEENGPEVEGALCWDFFNDTGNSIVAVSGIFDNSACDPEEPTVEDCNLSLHEASEFETLETGEGFDLQAFRLSGGVIPPGAPPIEIDSVFLLAQLTTANFFVYGFGFTSPTFLTLTQVETIPEPATLMMFGMAGLAAVARRRFQRR
jgi:hypothetical protein